jgi:glutamate formiminotransferase
MCQVSSNIVDYRVSPIIEVFKTIKRIAEKYTAKVTGSEIIGLVPLNSIIHHDSIKNMERVNRKILKSFKKDILLKLWTENDLIDKII